MNHRFSIKYLFSLYPKMNQNTIESIGKLLLESIMGIYTGTLEIDNLMEDVQQVIDTNQIKRGSPLRRRSPSVGSRSLRSPSRRSPSSTLRRRRSSPKRQM
jgi:hypothetical protein